MSQPEGAVEERLASKVGEEPVRVKVGFASMPSEENISSGSFLTIRRGSFVPAFCARLLDTAACLMPEACDDGKDIAGASPAVVRVTDELGML